MLRAPLEGALAPLVHRVHGMAPVSNQQSDATVQAGFLEEAACTLGLRGREEWE